MRETSSFFLFVLKIALALQIAVAFSIQKTYLGTVFYDATAANNVIYRAGVHDDRQGLAFAVWEDEGMVKGFGRLTIDTNPAVLPPAMSWYDKDRTMSYALGYLEGALTQERIYQHYTNMHLNCWYSYSPQTHNMPQEIKNYLATQKAWIEGVLDQNKGDYYYEQVASAHYQYLGLVDGYNALSTEEQKVDYADLYILTGFGDMSQIKQIFAKAPKQGEKPQDFELFAKARESGFRYNPFLEMKPREIEEYTSKRDHCSGLVKWTKDKKELLLAHGTWYQYSSMSRIWKDITLNLLNPSTNSKSMQFSSYPGILVSNDDFFYTDHLWISETTNSVFNLTLLTRIKPQTLSSWTRVLVANRMGKDGESWIQAFTKHNSGTYNNQYVIVNLDKFVPGSPRLADGLIYIAEQIPGLILSKDVTPFVQEKGYWPSYNVPAIFEIYNISGYPDILRKDPTNKEFYDYNECFRAKMMARDQGKIQTMKDIAEYITLNDYFNDPLSKLDPGHAVSSRWDLRPVDKSGFHSCHGGTDGKVGSFSAWSNRRKVLLKLGPPNKNGVATFRFTPGYCGPESASILGLPIVYNYNWIEYQSSNEKTSKNKKL